MIQNFYDPDFSMNELILGQSNNFVNKAQKQSVLNEMKIFIIMGSVGLVLLLLMIILSLCFKKIIMKKLKVLKDKIVFNGIIRSIHLTYMKVLISMAL